MKKRRFIAMILVVLTATGLLSGCSHGKSDELTKITLNEVAHSIFYAPQYVAILKTRASTSPWRPVSVPTKP